jgi:small-conductance mechanosensitive channel
MIESLRAAATSLENVNLWTELALARGLRLAGIFLIAVVLIRLLKALTARLVSRPSAETRVAAMREQQTRTLAGILHSAGTAVIVVGAILTALPELGFNVAPVAAAAGIASLAIGFGAQNLIRDVINGFFIVFEDQFVVGDAIRVGETAGRVEHLTLRRTVVRDAEGALVVIPNGEIRRVANLSRDWSQLFVDVAVANAEEVDRALAVLAAVAAEFREAADWSAALVDGPRVLGVEAFTMAGTTLRMQLRTLPGRQHDVARELRRRIKARFEQERIALADVQPVKFVGGTLPAGRPPQV